MIINGREIWITGSGLLSSLGEGVDAHRSAIAEGRTPVLDRERFAPYAVHPLPAIEFDRQIPKKLDQRQMENWQRIGVHAAGMALEAAGMKGDAAQLAHLHLITAAGGGERDIEVDAKVLDAIRENGATSAAFNRVLMSDLRPTLFLAQLPNLLAGNIHIVHGVAGGSRSFMGEETAGIEAARSGCARIAAGQGDAVLLGGAYNGERWDFLLNHEIGGMARRGDWQPVFARSDTPGWHLGSMGAFLVFEAAEAAIRRGRSPANRVVAVASDRSRRSEGSVERTLNGYFDRLAPRLRAGRLGIVTCASGAAGATAEETRVLAACAPGAPVVAIGDLVGYGAEAQFPAGIAFADMILAGGLPPLIPAGQVDQVVVICVGGWRGEGVCLIERAV